MASSVEKQSHPAIDHVDDNERKEEEERFGYAMQLVCSSVMSMSLQSAIELSVFDIIAGAGPNAKLSSSEIAAQIGTKNPEAPLMLDRILRLLATYTVLNCSVSSENGTNLQRLYSLSPVSKYFLTDEDGGSLGPIMALIQDKIFLESWFQLKDAVVEGGIPFNRAHGTHAFEYAGLDTRFNQVLNKGMLDYTTLSAKKMLDLYKGFEHLTKLVDVGGGLGVTIDLITSRYPHIKGVNFDLPHVIKNAPSYPGVEHVGGDMFESVPSGDAVFMKWILHDWSDEHCLKLLKNCYNAVPENGKVIIVEGLLPAMPETMTAIKNVCLSDVLMMTQNPGGKERSQEEFTVLATAAGFKGIRYECFVCSNWVMELFK